MPATTRAHSLLGSATGERGGDEAASRSGAAASSAGSATGQAGALLSAVRRFTLILASLDHAVPDVSLQFKALWRLHRTWVLEVPP